MRKYSIAQDVREMLRKYNYIPLSIAFLVICSCQVNTDTPEAQSIIFVGDLLLDRGVRERIEHRGIDNLFHPTVDSVFAENNIVIANLECPATKIKEPINKQFIFRAEPEWLETLKKHGITHLNLANNHSMDQGRDGLADTKTNILKSGLFQLGFGRNVRQACEAKLIATDPRNIYIFSSLQVPSENWPYLEDKPCICEESIDSIANHVIALREDEPGCVIIVQLHWGVEHTLIPITSQKQQAYKLIDSGADCIIGHHTHTVQTVELYKEKPIYYSIGNFIFDQSEPVNTKGLMVQMNVTASSIKFDTLAFVIEKCVPQFN